MSLDFLLKTFCEEDIKPVEIKKKDEFSLAGYLQRERLRLKRAKKPRLSSSYFNPSTIVYGYCKRLKVAQLLGITNIYVDIPTPKTELMFDLGNAIHDIIQGYFWSIGVLEGNFQCTKCNKSWWDTSPTTCPLVKSHRHHHLRYREVPLNDIEYQISGRADGVLSLKEKRLLEIKSIANRQVGMSDRQICFEDLTQPRQENIVQIMIYMMIKGIHVGDIMYVSKNSHQIKTFEVKYDHQVIAPYLTEIKEVLDYTELFKQGKVDQLPEPCTKTSCTCEALTLGTP